MSALIDAQSLVKVCGSQAGAFTSSVCDRQRERRLCASLLSFIAQKVLTTCSSVATLTHVPYDHSRLGSPAWQSPVHTDW